MDTPAGGHWRELSAERSRLYWDQVGGFSIEGGERIVVGGGRRSMRGQQFEGFLQGHGLGIPVLRNGGEELAVFHVGSVAAGALRDNLSVFRVLADLTRRAFAAGRGLRQLERPPG